MGIMDLFGGKAKYPQLDASSAAASTVDHYAERLAALHQQTGAKLVVVPGDGDLYVFVGNPPKAFGLAWYEGDEEHNLKKFAEAKGVNFPRMQALTERLGEMYAAAPEDVHFTHQVGGKPMTVIASDPLAAAVRGAIAATVA